MKYLYRRDDYNVTRNRATMITFIFAREKKEDNRYHQLTAFVLAAQTERLVTTKNLKEFLLVVIIL